LNLLSPSAIQASYEYSMAIHSHFETLAEVDGPYHPKATYPTQFKSAQGTVTIMKDDRENFQLDTTPSATGSPTDLPLNEGFIVDPDSLTKPFMFTSLPPVPSNSGVIPVIVPYQMAEQLLGLTPVGQSGTVTQKLNQMRQVQDEAKGLTVSYCYRNSASDAEIQDVLQPPATTSGGEIVYSLPDPSTCGVVPISKDTRTAQQKLQDAQQDKFNSSFGDIVTADQQKVTFRVIGLSPDATSTTTSANNSFSILQSMVGSSLNGFSVVPASLYNNLPDVSRLNQIFAGDPNTYVSELADGDVVEFSSAASARSFIDDKSCIQQPDSYCGTKDKPFILASFGSNSIALSDLQSTLAKWLSLAGLLVVGIASIFSGSIVGRVIADSRKESAVFRAIGFKKVDLAMTYIFYTLLVASLVAASAAVLGIGCAFIFELCYSITATTEAQLAFSSLNIGRTFGLFQINTSKTLLVLTLVYGSTLLGAVVPLLNNTRRNPIKDMRSD
jgi:hypothetical protein